MKAVLISIRPKWCELIASGKKTIEVRKTAPKIKTPFKCYIYCTKDNEKQFWIARTYSYLDDHAHNAFDKCGNGTVIGEFVCDRIYGIVPDENGWGEEYGYSEHDCLSDSEMLEYLGDSGRGGYGWHISDLVIYDEPKKLSDFYRWYDGLTDIRPCENGKPCEHEIYDYTEDCQACAIDFDGTDCPFLRVTRPPQSWCYVEAIT